MRRLVPAVAAAAVFPAAASLVAAGAGRRATRKLSSFEALEPSSLGAVLETEVDDATVTGYLRPGTATDARPLVFVHGWGSTSYTAWSALLPDVAATTLCIDLPGHGRSGLTGRWGFEVAARAVNALVEQAGLQDPVLVAHSMGGPVALTAVRQAPGRFSGLVMVATSSYWKGIREGVVSALGPRMRSNNSYWYLAEVLRRVEGLPDQAAQAVWAWQRRPDPLVLANSAAALRRFDAQCWGADVTLPPSVWVVPQMDRVLPPRFQVRSAQKAGGRLVWVPRGGHSFMVLDPSPLIELLNAESRRSAGDDLRGRTAA